MTQVLSAQEWKNRNLVGPELGRLRILAVAGSEYIVNFSLL